MRTRHDAFFCVTYSSSRFAVALTGLMTVTFSLSVAVDFWLSISLVGVFLRIIIG